MSAEKQETSLAVILKEHAGEFRQVAPKYVNINRLTALAIEAKQRNPLLAKCTAVSVINFCMKMAETGTDRVGAGGMWAVPFFNGKTGTYDMVPIPDWRLIVEKARRAKVIKHATAEAVYEKDVFEYERGLNPKLTHKPAKKDRGDLAAVYCVYTLPDGTKDFAVMLKEEVDAIRKRSKAKDSGPWITDPEEMAKKTVIKRALKIFEGASPELTKLIDTDNAVVGFPDLALPEPIAEPKELAEPETTESAEGKAEGGQGSEKTEPVVSQLMPTEEKPTETKRGPGRPPKEKPEDGKEIDYKKFLDEKGMRIGETTEAKPCANPKCPQGKNNQPCGKVTEFCIVCLRKMSGKFN